MRVVKLKIILIRQGSGCASGTASVDVPAHASVSVVSAACAVCNPTSITTRAMTRAQSRSIAEPQPVRPLAAYHGRQRSTHAHQEILRHDLLNLFCQVFECLAHLIDVWVPVINAARAADDVT